ncbi:MAG: hypothetical protein V4557_10930 [Bacteroidota bacterium]
MKKIIFLLIVPCLAGSVSAQQVLKITEMDEAKKYLSGKEAYVNSSLVDINSTLQIEIKKKEIKKRMGDQADLSMPVKTVEAITFLNTVLQKQNRILNQFKRNIRSYDPSDPAEIKRFNDSMKVIGEFAVDLFVNDPKTLQYYSRKPIEIGLIEGIFYAVGKRLDDLQAELTESGSGKKTSLQLGVWIHTKAGITPIHLKGYDELPEQGYYSVDRWQIMPTKEQLDQLQQLQSFASANKETGLEVINVFLQKTADQFRDNFSKLSKDNLAEIQAAFTAIKTELQSSALQSKIEILGKNYTNLLSELQPKINQYQSWLNMQPPPVVMLSAQLKQDSRFLKDGIDILSGNLTSIIAEIEALPELIRPKADALKLLVQQKINAMVKTLVPPEIAGLIEGYKFDVASLAYSDKILKLSVNNAPVTTVLDLGTTGKRGEGDKILVKLTVVNETGKPVIEEARDITMYSLAVHLQGTVGVIFAHPTTTTAITKQFQMAPYYNLLFKSVWPWTEKYHRRSVMNNSFWDFSWGLHVSTPDFNKDDVPELGVGIAVSGIKDILQIGFAHNIFENKPYWFFGIRLPVPSMNFGGSGHTTGN